MEPKQPSWPPLNRRAAIKWVLALAAAPLVDWTTPRALAGPAGTLTDPDLLHPAVPWERLLTERELSALAALCDTILPADDRSPGAGALKVHEFIDEWVSAPYPAQKRDRPVIRRGLRWLDGESKDRFQKEFAALDDGQKAQICDDISHVPTARPEYRRSARFFARVRDLSMSAFYTTSEGMRDLRYIGNVPLAVYSGPPRETLAHLGLL